MKKRVLLLLSCLFISIGFIVAQTTQVTGVVVDDTGEPAIGATVVVKGTTIGTISDADGKFVLNVPADGKTLVFSLLGMKKVEVPVSPNMHVRMENDEATALDEVIVVAYGTQKKEALTGAVEAINAKDLEKRAVTNVGAALEGMGTGVQVNNSYGEPGKAPTIRIRGFGSVSGNMDPLYVVDGVVFSGSINNISPNDIENVSVLKDATSAALYGSRAANGVILITTKRGKAGSLNISINQGIYNRGLPDYDKLGVREYMETAWTGLKNSYMTNNPGWTDQQAAETVNKTIIEDYFGEGYNIFGRKVDNKIVGIPDNQLFDLEGNLASDAIILPGIAGDLDWFDAVERTGHRQEYVISGSAASDKMKAYYSASYLNEQGYLRTSDFSRFTGRANITFTPKKWLETGANFNGMHSKANNSAGEGDGLLNNLFSIARNIAPVYPVHLHDANGDYVLDQNGEQQYDHGEFRQQYRSRHALYESLLNQNKTIGNNFGLQVFAEATIFNDFKLLVKGNMDNYTTENMGYDNSIIGDGQGLGRARTTRYTYKSYTASQQLSWAKSFNDVHNVDAMLVHEFWSWSRNYLYGAKQDESLPGNEVFNNFSVVSTLVGQTDREKIESFLGRARYNYDNKYFVEASLRRDGSSRFHPSTRWGTFWSAGGSWSVSKEKFLENATWIDHLKLRASYGEVGNNKGTTLYGYMNLWELDNNAGAGAVSISQESDPNIKWEALANFSTAVEGYLFNRLNFRFEYFNKSHKDMLFKVARPLSTGANNIGYAQPTIVRNIGTLSNRGFEIDLGVDIIKKRDFTWNVGADATFLTNEITGMPEQMKNGYVNGTKKWMEGKSIYEFWLYQWAGVDQMDGSALYLLDPEKKETAEKNGHYREINGGEYTTHYTYAKKDFSGSAIPDVTGSVRTTATYKDFTFSALCTYAIGGKMLDNIYSSLMSVGTKASAIHKDISKAWKEMPQEMKDLPENERASYPNRIDKNGVPAVNTTRTAFATTSASNYLIDNSYFSIKNISLSYRLPKSFVSKLDLSTVNIGANVENVALFAKRKGLDPQQSFSGTNENRFMPSRIFSLSLNITL